MDSPPGPMSRMPSSAAGQRQRELDAALGVPEATRQLDLEDDDRGMAEQRGGRDGRQEPDGEQDAAAELHARVQQRPVACGAEAHVLHGAGPADEARTTPHPEHLLRSVCDEYQADDEPDDEQTQILLQHGPDSLLLP